MADTILSDDLTVYYLAENRRKQIRWTGGTAKTDVQKMVTIYDAIQDLFTVGQQMDDGIILSGETPAEYTIGKIDAGEIEPWFIDLETMEHIIGDYQNFTGCALKTSGWTRDLPGDGTGNTGIVVVPVTSSSNNIIAADIGDGVTHADGDLGTLLDVVITGGATDYLFIRPTSNAAVNDWDSTSLLVTCDTAPNRTAPQEGAGTTGEMIWGNVYTQGALDPETHAYMFQGGERITSNDATDQDWWVDGHIDRNVPITDYTTADFPILDDGYITVFGRQYSFAYTYTIIRMNTTTGGAVSAGLSSGADINNTTGYWTATTGNHSTTFTVGEEAQKTGDPTVRVIITAAVEDVSVSWYQIGDPQTNIANAEELTGQVSGCTATLSQVPQTEGPAALGTPPTLTFANVQIDITDDGTTEPYGIEIDVNQNTLTEMYEYLKYIMRRGSVTDLDGLDGQEYIGIDYRINYATVSGTVPEGNLVTGATSGATGIVVSHDVTDDVALLRNSRGTFVDGERIWETDGVNEFDAAGLTVTNITPVSEMAFGTLAGGVFFGGVGVVLSDYQLGQANQFILKDANGIQTVRPTSITMIISNLLEYDWASCHRLTGSGGSVNKEEYSAAGGEAIGDATIVVDSPATIAVDVPGKSTGGRLILVDVDDNNQEYAIRYDSWDTATFTLSNIFIASAEGGTNTTTIVASSAFINAEVGDLVLNATQGPNTISYISAVIDDSSVTIDPPISGQTTGDEIEINAVPVITATGDFIYVPIVLKFIETGVTSASSSMTYDADIYGRTRVRNTGDAPIKIKPFTSDVTIDTGGGSTTAVRTTDPVYGA